MGHRPGELRERRRAGGVAPDELEIEGRVDVQPEARPVGQLGDRDARDVPEPSRQAVVRGQVRHAGEDRRVADRRHVGGVPVVGDGARLARRGGGDQLRDVLVRRERDGARAEHDEPTARTDVRHERAQPLAERSAVRASGDDANVISPVRPEARREILRCQRASRGDEPCQLAGMLVGFRVQDSNGNGLHAATVAGCAARAIEVAVGRTVRAYIGLGANVGDARGTLAEAVTALSALPGDSLRGVSRLYRTRPVGVIDQPDFLNAVAALDVPAGPDPASGAIALLVQLKDLERAFGRRRRRRWGPRELDLDLLLFGRHRLAVERPQQGTPLSAAVDPGAAARLLEVPHPSMRDRLFVLAPLADLAPRLVPPGWGATVATAAARRSRIEAPGAVEPLGRWDGRRWAPSG
jgi:2-amino-4-hydroxy-6-hydroxymethyldihydropteridine diphosphokinase